MTNMQDVKRPKSEAYLKKVSPLGGTLTAEESEAYRKLLVEEGTVSVSISDLLVELQITLSKNPIPQACIVSVAGRD